MTEDFNNQLLCVKCALCRGRTNVVLPTPCQPGGLLAIGEGPGADEDLSGKGFVGSAGQRLDELMRSVGFVRGRDYGVANIVCCRPPGNRKPTKDEIGACVPFLADSIAKIRPSVLLLVGNTAADVIQGISPLGPKIEASQKQPRCDFSAAHTSFVERLRRIDPSLHTAGILAIPMPHTSGRSWNGRSKKGERWSVIGASQVRLACSLVRGTPVESLDYVEAPRQGSLDI